MTPMAVRCYELLKTVPQGKVTTYKKLAEALGTRSYRAIGQFMRHNPYAFEACPEPSRRVPCHRVVASDGKMGGFKGKSTGFTISEKIKILQEEGVEIENGKVKDFDKVLYTFPQNKMF